MLSLLVLSLPFHPILPAGPNQFYVGNRAPLKPSALYKLPIGSIQPQGWLQVQLKNEASGETGKLEEISPWLAKKNNAWITPGGKGEHGWEETPYWLKGYGDLGYVLRDPRIQQHAKVWIEGVLATQRPNGYFGPASNLVASGGKADMWPNMAMLYALRSYNEWCGDKRILTAMTKYFHWQDTVPENDLFLSYWEKHRVGDNLDSIFWLYNRTGDPFLLDLARKFHRKSADWVSGVANWHGVNFSQAFREPEQIAELEPDVPGAASTEADYQKMRKLYGQVPGGMFGADENARPGFHDPRQGTETCAMVEMMLSDELLLTADGNPKWADRCEDVAFNSLPAALTANEEALHYLTAPNLVNIDAESKSPGFENSGPMLLFNPYDHRCCQHNVSHGWPYFAEHLWMATAGNGLAATLYAPSMVHAKVGSGTDVSIKEQTGYPFRDRISIRLGLPSATRFPLSLRIPSWAHEATVSVNGKEQPVGQAGGFVSLDRVWHSGDTVVLKLPMKLELQHWAQNGNAVSVNRGPLSYALQIGQKSVKSKGTKEWPATAEYPAWEVHPTTAWNYGLTPDLSQFKVVENAYDPNRQPFEPGNVPVEIYAPARQIPEWQIDRTGLVATLQPSPAYSRATQTRVVLVPMASERLRISEFPTVSPSGEAVKWKPPVKFRTPIPASSSHTNEGDTVDALSTGVTPNSSHDMSIPRFTWWDRRGSSEWVEYNFPKTKRVSSVKVFWFDDKAVGGQCRVPLSWKLQGFSDGAWQDINRASPYGVAEDRFNRVTFEPLRVQKLRIVAKLKPNFSGGILQWKVE